MSAALHIELDRYLTIRRAVGFKLGRAELLLADYLRYLDTIGADAITTHDAFAWASLPPNGSSSWWGQRLSVVRAFARHLHAIDPIHEVPLLYGHRATHRARHRSRLRGAEEATPGSAAVG